MEKLINYIQQFVKLSNDAIYDIHKLAITSEYKKNEFILSEGQICNHIWFCSKGMLRKFILEDGNEKTCWIHTEGEIFTSLKSYSEESPASEYLQALENSTVISISKENSKLLAHHQSIMRFTNMMMEKAFVDIDTHTREFNQRDAKGKYEYLRQIAPEMTRRAKLGHIASVLGMSQETLSRIRSGKG